MKNILSALAAIAVYSRICELGHPNAAVVCGIIVGILMRYVVGEICGNKRVRRRGTPERTHK